MLKMHSIVDEQPFVSVITKIELLGFNTGTSEEQAVTEIFTNAALIFHLDDAVISRTIALRKQYRIKLPEAIIAATAMVQFYPCNPQYS